MRLPVWLFFSSFCCIYLYICRSDVLWGYSFYFVFLNLRFI